MPNYPYTFQLPPLNVQDIPNDGVAGEFLGINGSGVLDWLTAGGTGDMLKADNLLGLASYPTARTNLGLGTGDSPTFANLTLTSPSLVSSAPVTISQTWNGTGSTVFTALQVNATTPGTTSSSNSLLLDLQVGGVSQFKVTKTGAILLPYNYTGIIDASDNSSGTNYTWNGPRLGPLAQIRWSAGSPSSLADTILLRDGAANTLALRNGANAQTFNVYGTYTSGTSYERLTLSAPSAANAIIGTNKGSGGGTARGLDLQTDGVARMTITTAGDVGIGTTAPLERLHVLGGKVLFGDATDSTGTAGNGDLTLRAWRAPQLNMVANNTSGEPFGLNLKVGATTLAGMSLNTGSGEVKIGGFWTGGYFPTFYSNNVERMRIDTAGNLGIGTTSPSSKLHVAETWNNAGTAFCAIKSVITDTNSLAGSDFLELYSGTSTQPLRMDINKTGQINIYGTWTDASNYERLSFSAPTAGNAIIGTNKSGGSSVARGLEFQTDGVTRMTIAATGEISTGNNRIGVTPGGLINNGGALGLYFGYSGTQPGFTIASAQIIMTAPIFKFNVLDNTGPALKRSSTTLQTRLADDSAFAPIQGKLTTDTAYTGTVVAATGYITIYDSTGTAYRVPCAV